MLPEFLAKMAKVLETILPLITISQQAPRTSGLGLLHSVMFARSSSNSSLVARQEELLPHWEQALVKTPDDDELIQLSENIPSSTSLLKVSRLYCTFSDGLSVSFRTSGRLACRE